jgi:hypothetical protein
LWLCKWTRFETTADLWRWTFHFCDWREIFVDIMQCLLAREAFEIDEFTAW